MDPEVKLVDFPDRPAFATFFAPVSGNLKLGMIEGSEGSVISFREMLEGVWWD